MLPGMSNLSLFLPFPMETPCTMQFWDVPPSLLLRTRPLPFPPLLERIVAILELSSSHKWRCGSPLEAANAIFASVPPLPKADGSPPLFLLIVAILGFNFLSGPCAQPGRNFLFMRTAINLSLS